MKRGLDILRDKVLNRSIAFGRRERDRLGVRGLLPYRVATRRQMVDRVMANLERLPRDIDRYMLLSGLQERNQGLFYQTLIDHIERLLPIIYTPTVGEACKAFSHMPETRRVSSSRRTIAARSGACWVIGPPSASASSSSLTDSGSWAWEISVPMAWASL